MNTKRAIAITTIAITLTALITGAIFLTKKTGIKPKVETKADYTLNLSKVYYPSRLIDKDTPFNTSSTWRCTVETTIQKQLSFPINRYRVYSIVSDLYNELDVNGKANEIIVGTYITQEQATQEITFDCWQIQYTSHTTDTITCQITWAYSVNNTTIYAVTYNQVFRNVDPDYIDQDIYLNYNTTNEKYVVTSQQWDGTYTEQNQELQDAYNEGSNDAYDSGYDYGYDYGYDTGYATGYQTKGDLADGNFASIQEVMLNVLTMPFTFISQGFNVTLWPNTPYAINIGNFIKSLIAIATILFIIKMFTSGFTVIGNYTGSKTTTRLDRQQKKATIEKTKAETRNINAKTDKGK